MSQESTPSGWWDLHVRVARGEQLSPTEQREYDSALAQHDRSPLAIPDLQDLKRLRLLAASLAQENSQLRVNVDALELEARQLERQLNQQTRELLGVTE